jgi:hypothetical protein
VQDRKAWRHTASLTLVRIGALEGNVKGLVRLLSLVAKSPAISATLDDASREDDSLDGYEQLLSCAEQGRTSASKRGE